jgi:hypothetical protein
MSKITSVYDALLSELAALYPTKTRIPYPYSLSDNNARFMIDGYGLVIGDSLFEQFEFCNFMTARTVSVVLTKEVIRTDSNYDVVDDIVKAMLENVYEVQKLFYSYNELGVPNDIAKVEIGSVSGVEEVTSGNSRFVSMTAIFQFSILESL